MVVSRICGCRRWWKASKGCFLRRLLFQTCFKDSFNYSKIIVDWILLIVCSYHWHGKISSNSFYAYDGKDQMSGHIKLCRNLAWIAVSKLFKIHIHLVSCQPMKLSLARLSWLYYYYIIIVDESKWILGGGLIFANW